MCDSWKTRQSVLRSGLELARIAASSDAGLIHTHFTSYDVPAWCASLLLRIRGKRTGVVWHYHSDFVVRRSALRRLKDLVKYRLMGPGVRVFAVSDHIRKRVIDAGFDPGAAETLHNGIDFNRVSAPSRSRAAALHQLELSPDNRLLLLFGWEPITKGVDVAIDAVRAVIDLGFPVVLGVVGTDRLRDFVDRRTNRERLPWLHLLAPVEDVVDLFQAASVFLSASRAEGFPYSMLEALAFGLPVVATDLPGTSWARGVPSAVLFPSGNSQLMAEAIAQVLRWSPEDQAERISAAQRFVKDEFHVEAWAAHLILSYKQLLSSGYSYNLE